MQPKVNNITMCYNYNNHEKEYVFAYRGRPFAVLVSDNFPTPASSFVDHHLVLELGLKMKEIQCKKISFCGKKLRLLGKVSCTVQCVVNGSFLGNFNFKANVIEDLKFHFDSHCIAGAQMTMLLNSHQNASCSQDTPDEDESGDDDDDQMISSPRCSSSSSSPSVSLPSTPQTSPRRSLALSSKARTSATSSSTARPTATSSAARPSACPSSPPGFHPQPQFGNAIVKQKRLEINVTVGNVYSEPFRPLIANTETYSDVFKDADLQPTSNAEIHALLAADPNGKLDKGNLGQTQFTMTSGYKYDMGHGREKCGYAKCVTRDAHWSAIVDVPHNCCWHRQWLRPPNFKPCAPGCYGGLCQCLDYYK